MEKDGTDQMQRGDRRQKTPLDYTNQLSGLSNVGIGGVILFQLMSQGNTLNMHSDLIKEIKTEQSEMVVLQKDMRNEFTIDIETFKLKHLNLENDIQECSVQQRQIMDRITDLERKARSPEEWERFEERIKEWAKRSFAKRDKE